MLEGSGAVSTQTFDASQGFFNFQDGELIVNGGAYTPSLGINVGGAFNPVLSLQSGASSISGNVAAVGEFGGTGTLHIGGGSTVQSAGAVVGVTGGNGIVNVEGAPCVGGRVLRTSRDATA